MSCEDIVGVGGDTLGVFTSAAQLAAVAGPAWLCRISPVQPGAARQQPRGDRRAAAANTVDASFTEVTEAPKSEVTTSPSIAYASRELLLPAAPRLAVPLQPSLHQAAALGLTQTEAESDDHKSQH